MTERARSLASRKRRIFTENERLREEVKRWNADAARLSGCLLAIRAAGDHVPAEVLRGIAYDAALNCITPDVAEFQIERRTQLANEQSPDKTEV